MLASTEVTAVRPVAGHKVLVEARGHAPQEFDAVVLATHSDQALQLLGSSAPQARPCSLWGIGFRVLGLGFRV